jgi:Protein of unknown function (DUF2946)
MSLGARNRWRRLIGAIALVSVLQHAWLLALHTTSPLITLLDADSAHQAGDPDICSGHQQRGTHQERDDAPGDDQGSKTSCPICLGLASLHLAVLNSWDLPARSETGNSVLQADLREDAPAPLPLKIRNRGPPLLV